MSRTGFVVTATLTAPNPDLASGDQVTIAGAVQADYNGTFTITVLSPSQFTYTIATSPAQPTGTITYTSSKGLFTYSTPKGLVTYRHHKFAGDLQYESEKGTALSLLGL